MLLTWWATVLRLTNSRAAISGFVSPSASSPNTSCSRAVRIPMLRLPVRDETPRVRRNAAIRSASRVAPSCSYAAWARRACSVARSGRSPAVTIASATWISARSYGSPRSVHAVSALSRTRAAALRSSVAAATSPRAVSARATPRASPPRGAAYGRSSVAPARELPVRAYAGIDACSVLPEPPALRPGRSLLLRTPRRRGPLRRWRGPLSSVRTEGLHHPAPDRRRRPYLIVDPYSPEAPAASDQRTVGCSPSSRCSR